MALSYNQGRCHCTFGTRRSMIGYKMWCSYVVMVAVVVIVTGGAVAQAWQQPSSLQRRHHHQQKQFQKIALSSSIQNQQQQFSVTSSRPITTTTAMLTRTDQAFSKNERKGRSALFHSRSDTSILDDDDDRISVSQRSLSLMVRWLQRLQQRVVLVRPLKQRQRLQLLPSMLVTLMKTIASRGRHLTSTVRRWLTVMVVSTTVLLSSFTTATSILPTLNIYKPSTAHASAPIMALPKAEARDPGTQALDEAERRGRKLQQEKLNENARKANEIERTQGTNARVAFENEQKRLEEQSALDRQNGLKQLKRDLLKQGIDPVNDLEGKRQVILYEQGVDLGEVPGTTFNIEKQFEKSSPKRSFAYKKETQRQILASMVEEMDNRGEDYVEYFEKNPQKTISVLSMPTSQAKTVLDEYQTNLEQYGQVTVPGPGEMSALEIKDQRMQQEAAERAAMDKGGKKKLTDDEKAAIRAEKEAKREIMKKEKAEKRAAKLAEKEQKKAEKIAAAAAASSAAAAAAAAAAANTALPIDVPVPSTPAEVIVGAPETGSDGVVGSTDGDGLVNIDSSGDEVVVEELSSEPGVEVSTKAKASKSSSVNIKPALGVVAAVGGGAYVLKFVREKAAKDEEERQRQLRLLMGGDNMESVLSDDTSTMDMDDELTSFMDDSMLSSPPETPNTSSSSGGESAVEDVPTEKPERIKKKRLGLKKVFSSKKKNNRETDLTNLLSASESNPSVLVFTTTLAKILTFGAPGRFPSVTALPGGMPMTKFDLEGAKAVLTESRTSANLEIAESAEIFANVVNCMLIDIVDLGSSALKEKDNSVAVQGVEVVIRFMQHAASLYDSVAESYPITPVTYGGELGKSKLEQLYTVFVEAGMKNITKYEDFDSQTVLLQDVFEINEKKAQGLMMKALQRQAMEAMKSGEGFEGMPGMEGMEGLLQGGMGGENGEGPSPEELKTMLLNLKDLKDQGAIPKEDFAELRKQFSGMFGASLDTLVAEASETEDQLGDSEKELLELMKYIMKED